MSGQPSALISTMVEAVSKPSMDSRPEPAVASPHVIAALIQALFHGLDVQLMMDPSAFDRQEMFAAGVKLLGPRFGKSGS